MSESEFEFDMGAIKLRFKDREVYEETVRRAMAVLAANDAHAQGLGNLCMAFAALDWQITKLYVPLLQCSEAQAVCIADENISRRCAVAIKLLHLEDVPGDWLAWVTALLQRADGELGSLRNRFIHDAYNISERATVRIDRRAKMGKPQSRQKTTVTYNSEHPTTYDELDRVQMRISTVMVALGAATQNLAVWRQTGQLPQLDPQWLPACMPKARGLNYQANSEAPELPLAPLEFEFD